MWLSGGENREKWYKFKFRTGQLLEGHVRDDHGKEQGTVLVEVLQYQELRTDGHVLQAKYVTASDSHYRWWMETGDGAAFASKGTYHLCEGLAVDCGYTRKGSLVHFEKFRPVLMEELEKKSPGWAFGRATGKFVKEYMKRAEADPAKKEKQGTLPWGKSPSGEDEGEESQESSSSGEKEDLKARMKELRDELKKLEKKTASKPARKEKAKPSKTKKKSGGEDSKKKRRKKKKPRKSSSDEELPAKGSGGKRPHRADEKKAKKKEKKAPDSTEAGEEKKAKKRAKKKEDSGASGSGKSGDALFGAAAEDQESDSSNGKRVDRGPFGSGVEVKYKKKGQETDSESDFRDAPLSQQASSQLRLVQYSKKMPGRLASRLLLKMQQEGARDFRGAMQRVEQKTPPAATHYLQTMMLPQLGAKMNLRTLRELKTLCTALDTLAVSKPAQAADILGQRIKALERATTEGHWSSAQFLELISPESSGLLERDEVVHLTKEYLLDQKLRNYDRLPPRGGKGERKGEKGKSEKGGAKGGGKNKDGKKEKE